ncbi:MAG TPA: carboxypeptidase-like regulatory domain-containing protein [Kofleriaceae bacterium]|nr:carboxypeptidase-like regulatory domain-containing protein [Kofleriaceae bacterium]
MSHPIAPRSGPAAARPALLALPSAALAWVALGCAGLAAGCAAGSRGAGGEVGEAGPSPEEPAGPRGQVSGLVRDADGEPIALAEVRAEPAGAPGAARALAISDTAGAFALDLPPGRYRVSASLGSLAASAPDVVVMDGRMTRLHLTIDTRPPRAAPPGSTRAEATTTGEIAGRITEVPSDRPFAGAVITALTPDLARVQMAISDERGRYRLRGLRPGQYDLSIYYQLVDRGAIELRRTGVAVDAGRVTRIDLELDLRVQR